MLSQYKLPDFSNFLKMFRDSAKIFDYNTTRTILDLFDFFRALFIFKSWYFFNCFFLLTYSTISRKSYINYNQCIYFPLKNYKAGLVFMPLSHDHIGYSYSLVLVSQQLDIFILTHVFWIIIIIIIIIIINHKCFRCICLLTQGWQFW